ncbi:hypothetical protein QQF64_023425 [Cirrhinus molitorella]|uniref:Uncharacterized protein n=1 Tax=Cirrhinus molitorella TaxID=172907 RepID=A0ABR3L8L6_9TELE
MHAHARAHAQSPPAARSVAAAAVSVRSTENLRVFPLRFRPPPFMRPNPTAGPRAARSVLPVKGSSDLGSGRYALK